MTSAFKTLTSVTSSCNKVPETRTTIPCWSNDGEMSRLIYLLYSLLLTRCRRQQSLRFIVKLRLVESRGSNWHALLHQAVSKMLYVSSNPSCVLLCHLRSPYQTKCSTNIFISWSPFMISVQHAFQWHNTPYSGLSHFNVLDCPCLQDLHDSYGIIWCCAQILWTFHWLVDALLI